MNPIFRPVKVIEESAKLEGVTFKDEVRCCCNIKHLSGTVEKDILRIVISRLTEGKPITSDFNDVNFKIKEKDVIEFGNKHYTTVQINNQFNLIQLKKNSKLNSIFNLTIYTIDLPTYSGSKTKIVQGSNYYTYIIPKNEKKTLLFNLPNITPPIEYKIIEKKPFFLVEGKKSLKLKAALEACIRSQYLIPKQPPKQGFYNSNPIFLTPSPDCRTLLTGVEKIDRLFDEMYDYLTKKTEAPREPYKKSRTEDRTPTPFYHELLNKDYQLICEAMENNLRLHGQYRASITYEIFKLFVGAREKIVEVLKEKKLIEDEKSISSIKICGTEKTNFQMGAGNGKTYLTPHLSYPIEINGCHSTSAPLTGLSFEVILDNQPKCVLALEGIIDKNRLYRMHLLTSLTIPLDSLINSKVDKLSDESKTIVSENLTNMLNSCIISDQAFEIYLTSMGKAYEAFANVLDNQSQQIFQIINDHSYHIHAIVQTLKKIKRSNFELELDKNQLIKFEKAMTILLAQVEQIYCPKWKKNGQQQIDLLKEKLASNKLSESDLTITKDELAKLINIRNNYGEKLQEIEKNFMKLVKHSNPKKREALLDDCGKILDLFYRYLNELTEERLPELNRIAKTQDYHKNEFACDRFINHMKLNYRLILAMKLLTVAAEYEKEGMEYEKELVNKGNHTTKLLFNEFIKIKDCDVCTENRDVLHVLKINIDEILRHPEFISYYINLLSTDWPAQNIDFYLDEKNKCRLREFEIIQNDNFKTLCHNAIKYRDRVIKLIDSSPKNYQTLIAMSEGTILKTYLQSDLYSSEAKLLTLQSLSKKLEEVLKEKSL